MSATHPDRNFASAHNQLTPFIVAVAIFAVSVAVSLLVAGLPH